MSRLTLLLVSLVACGSPITELGGLTTCESMTCGANQLCRASRNLPDDGGIPAACVTVPATCAISDCATTGTGTTCSECTARLCGCTTTADCYVAVQGRVLSCQ